MIKFYVFAFIFAFISPTFFGQGSCINKHQLLKMQSSELEDVRKFMNDNRWEFDGGGNNEFYNYFSTSISFDLARWTFGSYQNIQFYHGKLKPTIVIYQATKECYHSLISEIQKTLKGNTRVEPNFLVTNFQEGTTTIEFREYKSDYSRRQYSVLVYNKKQLEKELIAEQQKNSPSNSPPQTNPTEKQEEVVAFVASEPQYPGGIEMLYEDIHSKIKYPEYEKENNIQGTVYVSFIVEKNGTISDIKVERPVQGGPNLSTESIRVLGYLKLFSPATMANGTSVRYRYRVPIKFSLK